MSRFLFGLFVFGIALSASAGDAYAQNTLGDVIDWFLWDIRNFPELIATFSYIVGIGLGIWGVLKLKDHVDAPMQTPLRHGVLMLIGGGMLLALPIVAEALYESIGGGVTMVGETKRSGAWKAGAGNMALDEVLVALMYDIGPPIQRLIGAFAYLFALIFTVVGAVRLTKARVEGPRGPSGMGTLTTFIVAGALFSLGNIMGTFSFMFGSTDVATYAQMSFGGVDATAKQHVEVVSEAVLAFLMLVGWISFTRGWFILKAVADGGGNASLMAGITHILGGALAVNLGPLLNAVQETLGLTPFGITFS